MNKRCEGRYVLHTASLMRRMAFAAVAGAIALTSASGGGSSQPANPEVPAPTPPAFPAEVQTAAEAALGAETEVLVYGDLSKNGHQQAIAVNRLEATPERAAPGILVTRTVVIENDDGTWKEIFLCDQHLKNPSGYLRATPLAPVNGWRLQFEQDQEKGLQMYFTPLAQPKGGYIVTIGVRWNPRVKRYQSLDKSFQQFLGELTALETPESQARL